MLAVVAGRTRTGNKACIYALCCTPTQVRSWQLLLLMPADLASCGPPGCRLQNSVQTTALPSVYWSQVRESILVTRASHAICSTPEGILTPW